MVGEIVTAREGKVGGDEVRISAVLIVDKRHVDRREMCRYCSQRQPLHMLKKEGTRTTRYLFYPRFWPESGGVGQKAFFCHDAKIGAQSEWNVQLLPYPTLPNSPFDSAQSQLSFVIQFACLLA